MKTTIKTNLDREDAERDTLPLWCLDNGDVLEVFIEEYVTMLHPCKHCGHTNPHIVYRYCPSVVVIPGKKQPHRVSVICVDGCGVRTNDVYAEDDEADFKEALRMIAAMWNRQPGDTLDPAIEKAMKPSTHFFKSQEEAKEFYDGRGIPYHDDKIYIAVEIHGE